MKFKLILGILFGLFIAINVAKAGPLMNCSDLVFNTGPTDWNTTSENLYVTYIDAPTFVPLPLKTLYDSHNFGNVKSGVGALDQTTGWITINNTEAFHINLVQIFKPATYTVNDVGMPGGQQKSVNANPTLATYDYIVYNILVDVPVSGAFDENVTLEFEAQGDASPPCQNELFNVTFNVKGFAFPYTFVSSIPSGYTAEWDSTGLDATTNDSGSNGDNMTIYGPDGGAIILAEVTPNTGSPQAIDLGSLSATVNPSTKKILVKLDWLTNAPEVTSHYLLVRRGLNKTGPWLCDSSSLNTINDVVPGCDGYNPNPSYFVLRYGDVEPYSYFYAMLTSHSGAGTFTNTSLTIFDEYEGTSVNANTSITFYAYYYNKSDAADPVAPSEGGTCWAEFDDSWNSGFYQEDGNATFCSTGWNVSLPCTFANDTNWSTYGTANSGSAAEIYVNYTRPAGVGSAIWQLKDESGTYNVTIPSECWGSTIQFRVAIASLSGTSWNCLNYTAGSGWAGTGSAEVYANTIAYDVYEEGIFWIPTMFSMNGWNGTHYSYTKSFGFATEAIHKWNVTCNDTTGTFETIQDVQDDVNVSGIRPCALDPDCDIACGGAGTGYTNDDIMCYSNSGCSAVCTGTCAPESTCDSACSPYYGFSPDYGATCYPSFYCLDECSGGGPATPSYPEFSDFAWVLAAVLGAGGFVLMRRMRKY